MQVVYFGGNPMKHMENREVRERLKKVNKGCFMRRLPMWTVGSHTVITLTLWTTSQNCAMDRQWILGNLSTTSCFSLTEVGLELYELANPAPMARSLSQTETSGKWYRQCLVGLGIWMGCCQNPQWWLNLAKPVSSLHKTEWMMFNLYSFYVL